MIAILESVREFHDFLAAKKRKREPLRIHMRPVACASYRPSNARGFANFRASLRGVGDWGRASERLDRLEHELRARHGCPFPLPRRVLQNEDRSLTVFWQGATVRCLVDGYSTSIGDDRIVDAKIRAKKVTPELLDLLAFLVRIQAAS